MKDTELHST